jgi:homoserine dehydrogenase
MGIMNGTTNFMLSKMEDEGADYDEVLKEAQALGFAEADPTADVEGHDVQAKIALLAKLAYGQNVSVSVIPTAGISKITKLDFDFAKMLHSTIKLVGTAVKNESDGSVAVFVSPTMVPLTHPLATAKGPGNMVCLFFLVAHCHIIGELCGYYYYCYCCCYSRCVCKQKTWAVRSSLDLVQVVIPRPTR